MGYKEKDEAENIEDIILAYLLDLKNLGGAILLGNKNKKNNSFSFL